MTTSMSTTTIISDPIGNRAALHKGKDGSPPPLPFVILSHFPAPFHKSNLFLK